MSDSCKKKRKRSKAYYVQSAKKKRGNEVPRHVLQPGLKGFIVTCNNREKECIKEAYNLLNQFADKLYGPENPPKDNVSADEEDDISLALEKEIESLKSSTNERRFQLVKSKAKNCLFIKTLVESPTRLVQEIFSDIEQHKNQLTRFLLRMIPVEATCKAYADEIVLAANTVFENYFKDSKENQTYLIMLKIRNNNSLTKGDLLPKLISTFGETNSCVKPDLVNPDTVFNVDVICTVCCLSVLPGYFKYKKYNLLELAKSTEKQNKDVSTVKTEVRNQSEIESTIAQGESKEKTNAEINVSENKNQSIKTETEIEQPQTEINLNNGNSKEITKVVDDVAKIESVLPESDEVT